MMDGPFWEAAFTWVCTIALVVAACGVVGWMLGYDTQASDDRDWIDRWEELADESESHDT